MFVCCAQVPAKPTAFLMNRMIPQKDSSVLPSPERMSKIILFLVGSMCLDSELRLMTQAVQQQEQGGIQEDLCFHCRDSPGAEELQRVWKAGSSQPAPLPHNGVLCQKLMPWTDGKDGSWLSFPWMGKSGDRRKVPHCISVTGQLDLLLQEKAYIAWFLKCEEKVPSGCVGQREPEMQLLSQARELMPACVTVHHDQAWPGYTLGPSRGTSWAAPLWDQLTSWTLESPWPSWCVLLPCCFNPSQSIECQTSNKTRSLLGKELVCLPFR